MFALERLSHQRFFAKERAEVTVFMYQLKFFALYVTELMSAEGVSMWWRRFRRLVPLAFFCLSSFPGCGPEVSRDVRALPVRRSLPDYANQGTDEILRETRAYRTAMRLAFENRRFDELDARADAARSTKAKSGNGSWKISQFYEAITPSASDAATVWRLHENIHDAWVAAKPRSITARVAQAGFLVASAWRARSNGFSYSLTPSSERTFSERLRAARHVLAVSKYLESKCPVWWLVGLQIAQGEKWNRAEYDRFYNDAKSFEPTFWDYDVTNSHYLSIKWNGQPGEWEAAAERSTADPNGLGAEIYTRCVLVQFGNYDNVFNESKATWVRTKEGFDLMRQRYPSSAVITSAYCRLACIAGDRPTAKRLFDLLGGNAFSYLWINQDNLRRDRSWAHGNS